MLSFRSTMKTWFRRWTELWQNWRKQNLASPRKSHQMQMTLQRFEFWYGYTYITSSTVAEGLDCLSWRRRTQQTIHSHYLHVSYSRKLLSANFVVLWLMAKAISVKFGAVASFGMAKANNPWKFSPRKSYFLPICKRFFPQKFPTIQYCSEPSLSSKTGLQSTLEHLTNLDWDP